MRSPPPPLDEEPMARAVREARPSIPFPLDWTGLEKTNLKLFFFYLIIYFFLLTYGFLFNLLCIIFIISSIISILIVYYSNYLINKFRLETKYPKLAKFLYYRAKLTNYYIKLDIINIAIFLIIMVGYNLYGFISFLYLPLKKFILYFLKKSINEFNNNKSNNIK